ncbi:MAG: FKBP-type peptidyl-prolyl cis-trans isomerase [Candidatus Hydrothermarchaeales archaeon]
MVLEKGDFVKIEYTGRVKESGVVFDTTSEETAKEHGIYDDGVIFKPQPIVIGAGHILKGLDEALIGSEVGEEKKVDVAPEEGYGLRDPKLIKVYPVKEFKKRGTTPMAGMRVELDDKIGRIQSVGAGRVRVDFNHGLAGKALEYEFAVDEKINNTKEKIRLLLERHFPYASANDHEIRIKENTVSITLADIIKLKNEALTGKHYVARDIFRFLEGLEAVNFTEVFKKPVTKKKTKAVKKTTKKTAKKTTKTKKASSKPKKKKAKSS